jgi:hypothetical protein
MLIPALVRSMCAPTMFSSSCALPSPTSAGSHLPLFGQFIGTTAQSDFSSTYMSVVWHLPSRTGLRTFPKACWRSPGSRACCFLSVRGLLDYAGPDSHSRITQPPYCLPPSRKGVGILFFRLFEARSPRPPMPLSTLRVTPHDVTRKTRGQDGFAISFPAGTCTPTTCRFSPAHSELPVIRSEPPLRPVRH